MSRMNDLAMLERETLRRGCLTLESAAHEEGFCVWHLVRFLSGNRILDLDNDDGTTDPAPDSSCGSTHSAASINHAFLNVHGRAAVRGAQVTNGVWVVLAKLARVIVCGPDHIPADELARRSPSYCRRLCELQVAFHDEKARLDRYCAAHKTTQLFAPGRPSSQDLLAVIQRDANRCARHLDGTQHARDAGGGIGDMAACKTRTALLLFATALDMSAAAGSFLDLVSGMIFGHGAEHALPPPSVPQRTMPLVPKRTEHRQACPPPDIPSNSNATATTHMAAPSSPASVGEQAMPSGTPPRRLSVPAWPLTEDAVVSSQGQDAWSPGRTADAEHVGFAAIHMIDHQPSVEALQAPYKVAVPPVMGDTSRLRKLFSRKKR